MKNVMGTLLQDLRFAVRLLRKKPVSAGAVVLTIALGMGANSAMFGVVHGLLRPLPVKDPEQLVVLAAQTPGDETGFQFQLSYRELQDFAQQRELFQGVFASTLQIRGFSTTGKSSEFVYSAVSGNYFTALGIEPAAGRVFCPEEGEHDGTAPVMVLGYSFWQKRFGGNPGVIGTQVRVDGYSVTVVGVAAKGFHGTYAGADMDGYMPLGSLVTVDAYPKDFFTNRAVRALTVFARLQPHVELESAQAAATALARRMEQEYPETSKGMEVRVVPEISARPVPLRVISKMVPLIQFIPLVLSGLVLLLASLNVGNILLARAASRQKEMAIRAALGADRARLIRQMLTESVLMALLGTAAGLVLGSWATKAFARSLDFAIDTPVRLDFSFDRHVFEYALISGLASGVLIGIWPALRLSRTEGEGALREGMRSSGGPQSQRIQGALVVAQIAGSLVLLLCAGLFLRTLQNAEHIDLGFAVDHLLNVRLNPKWAGYDRQRTEAFYRELKQCVGAWPEIRSVSLTFSVPLGYYTSAMTAFFDERPLGPVQKPPVIGTNYIDAGYFETMRIPIVRGRAFGEYDRAGAPLVAIVNQTMANRFWPNQDPIGKHFHAQSPDAPLTEVVGVARDSKYLAIFEQPLPYFYVPESQYYEPWRVLQVRTKVPPERVVERLEHEIESIDPNMPFNDLETMKRSLGGAQGFLVFRAGAIQASVMGILGLIVALVGIYGVVSHSITQRTREMGVRIALGATPASVVRSVVWRALSLIGNGIVAGLIVAAALTRVLKGCLVSVSSTDPFTFVSVPLLLVLVAMTAAYIPARRAAQADPMVALRHD